jgi:hypothetical protein
MAVFVEANPPEILRASQKDESYINTIKNELADIVQRLFGKQLFLSGNFFLAVTFSLFTILLYTQEIRHG